MKEILIGIAIFLIPCLLVLWTRHVFFGHYEEPYKKNTLVR